MLFPAFLTYLARRSRELHMKNELLSFRTGRLSIAERGTQGAVMVLLAGGSEGGSDNFNRGAVAGDNADS
jgi:hypothetical protein